MSACKKADASVGDRNIDWDDFRYVQAVAEAGSVRGAGALLGVHGSTVARRLDQLEQRVATRLFARTPHGMELTLAGAEVIDTLHRVAGELERVERRLQNQGPEPAGTLRLALPRPLAVHLVIPSLPRLYHRHPDIELLLLTTSPLQQLHSGAADVAVCLTDEPPQELIGRPLGPVMASAYGSRPPSPDASHRGAPPGARWMGPDDPASLSAIVRARYFPTLPLGLRIEDPELLVGALQAGLGLGLLSCYLGDVVPGLARVGAVGPMREGEAWLFTRPESRGLARIQALSTFLQEVFASHRQALEGTVPLHEKLDESA